MKITFLGTGTSQGVPMIGCHCNVCQSTDSRDKRLRSSILIQEGDTNMVIDTTPDFRYQMLRTGTDHLEAILITHSHKDHIAGMDDVRAFNYFQKKAMDIYATSASQEVIQREFFYAFAKHKYPGVPNMQLHLVDAQPFEAGNWKIIPIQVMHHKMPVTGFRIGDFTYITDANYIAPEEKEKIKGTKTLVLNTIRQAPEHLSHFTLPQALEIADELGVEQAYFTHISHQMGLHEEVSQKLPPNRHLAYDGLEIQVNEGES